MPLTKAAPAADSAAAVPDHGAWPVVVAARKGAFDIVLIARGNSETDDVDQQLLAFDAHRFRQMRGVERANLLRQMLGNGDFGELAGGHG